ncbi:MAG TPA: 2-oxoacid:acceptor oxidoreductase subunit alpha [Candidatus Limnocylindrales bacterium]|jgi:2-oxoglutarate ferredoxin oxidoreductase subunit alpha|nr:2-oxoacid:acceptor oxidoreductase subunit alpha [Candidatus Limnocylindrales bacterium]
MSQDLIIGIAGSGGDGVVSAGESLITAAALEGYHGIMTKSFGSQIRGGEASCRLRLATQPVLNPNGPLDVAVALNWEDFRRFGAELPVEPATIIIYESNTGVLPDKLPLEGMKPAIVFSVPITEMALKNAGTDKAKNIIVTGLLAGWFGIARESMLAGIRKKFAKKGATIVEGNVRAFQAGLEFAESHPLAADRKLAAPCVGRSAKLLTDGNDMCAAAAIFAGCTFFAGYPITPSTEIMQFFDREVWKYGGTVLQAEDEIAGIGAVVGASFAGKKAMTATSGPGMSLKTEMLGLATIAELPLVCVNVQRGGPSTGIPTKAEQADLFQAAFSAHGDAMRPVLAPTSVGDMFGVTVEAFNLAERYQTPVIILSDQEIAQRKETVDPIDTTRLEVVERRRPTETELMNYARFKLTESGISPISHPGLAGGNYLAAGIEHNELGRPTASGEMHARMNEKRFRKFSPLRNRRDLFVIEGDPDAPIGLVSWGSVAGVAREALRLALEEGLQAKLLVPKLLYPVIEPVYQDFFSSVRRGLFIEQSFQAQLYRLLRMYVDVPAEIKILARSGSNPIQPSEVLDRLREMVVAIQGNHNFHQVDLLAD